MARRAGARRWGPGTGERRTPGERCWGLAVEGQWCLQKVSVWRHGVSSEDHAAVLSSCLSLCDGSIESRPVTMSKAPRGPGIQATPISQDCWVQGLLGTQLQTSNSHLSMERASFSGSTSPQHIHLGWDARCSPQHHLTIRLCFILLCLLRSSWPNCKGTPTLVPWPQGCLPTGRSIRGLSSVRDCSHLVTGSPSLPDKYRHAREMMLLLPTHRDRPSSAMYPAAILENGQVVHAAH